MMMMMMTTTTILMNIKSTKYSCSHHHSSFIGSVPPYQLPLPPSLLGLVLWQAQRRARRTGRIHTVLWRVQGFPRALLHFASSPSLSRRLFIAPRHIAFSTQQQIAGVGKCGG
jgi:hypothetical protein